ncbi:MAG: hypothetical protein KAG18_07435, partial [Sinobacterium sp.]|nr:hypothetical protein [Sinobacterium sp.]
SGITVTKKGEMLVADTKHHRVLIFNKIPTAAAGETDADAVLGASAFTTCPNVNSGSGAAGFKNPTAVWTDGKTLIVADTGHHRLLVWNNFDFTKPAASASFAIGQESLTNIGANQGSNLGAQTTPTASTLSLESPNNFNYTSFDVSANGALCVPDTGNNRVLIWRRLPTTSGVAADVVLGQDSFNRWAQWDDDQDESPDVHASARTLYAPVACKFVDNKLIVADAGTNRYLVFEAK